MIIGSGPAAAAVARARVRAGDEVMLLDIGERLDEAAARMLEDAPTDPATWPGALREALSRQPRSPAPGELPEKRVFGSDFPFRDRGQLAGVTTAAGGNRLSVSGALGGFSNAWGSQVMPFSRSTIDAWPVGYDELLPHYRAILDHIPFTGADDDYSELFPLLSAADPLPPLAPPLDVLMSRYQDRRSSIRDIGVTVGRARLAMRARDCISCGLCLTGCHLGLIYSAAQTVEELVGAGQITHLSGVMALRVGERDGRPWVRVRDVETGASRVLDGDRLFIACGGLGTTRLVLGSARPDVRHVDFAESVQFTLPFLSRRAYPDPRHYSTFTLNQVNLLVTYGAPGLDLAQLHLYPYNPSFEEQLPLGLGRFDRLTGAVLRRTVAALGYLPSWDSPVLRAAVSPASDDELPSVSLSAVVNPRTRSALRAVLWRLLRVAPALDLWPVAPVASVSGPAKSYHFGSSFPHVARPPRVGAMETDVLGRIAEWRHIHLVDGSVLPSVAATTFTLTVMANAHRIASAATEAG